MFLRILASPHNSHAETPDLNIFRIGRFRMTVVGASRPPMSIWP